MLFACGFGRVAAQQECVAEPAESSAPGLVIAQIDPKEYESLVLGALREVRQKRYGNSLLVFYEFSSEEV